MYGQAAPDPVNRERRAGGQRTPFEAVPEMIHRAQVQASSAAAGAPRCRGKRHTLDSLPRVRRRAAILKENV